MTTYTCFESADFTKDGKALSEQEVWEQKKSASGGEKGPKDFLILEHGEGIKVAPKHAELV